MALFFREDFHPQNVRKRGFDRYRELLARDWKTFLAVNFVTLLLCLPLTAGVVFALLTSSLLILLPASILGGMLAGIGLACLTDCIFRSLRNAPPGWWVNYRQALRQNWQGAMLPGTMMGLVIGVDAFCVMMLWQAAGAFDWATVAVLLAGALVLLLIGQVYMPQLVLFDQRVTVRLRNSLLFIMKYPGRSLAAAALKLCWWLAALLLLPWSAFLAPVLGLWFIEFVTNLMLYEQLDEAFQIEARIREVYPHQVDDIED